MKVLGIICFKCNTFTFSRAGHDCRHCTCGNCMIDGGPNNTYMRYSKCSHSILSWADIKQTTKELYNDWNNRKDKYGIIPLEELEDVTVRSTDLKEYTEEEGSK